MKNIFLVLFLLLSFKSFSQFTIIGKVVDENTKEPLIGVTILIKETSIGTTTDIEGIFTLDSDKEIVDLEISYVSYKREIQKNIVLVGELTTIPDIKLKEDVLEIGEVVITADRIVKSEIGLIDMKMKSTTLIDGISAEKMKSTGDGNAVEASKRVTGVSIENGKYVYVRGLGDRYSKTLVNGVEIPGLDPDRNSLQMDIFPTNLLNNIVVSKTFSPESTADFTGGLINIETKDIPESKQGSFSYSMGYNPQVNLNPNFISEKGSGTDVLGFDGGLRRLPIELSRSYIPIPYNRLNGVSHSQHQQNIINTLQSLNSTLGGTENMSMLDYGMGFTYGNTKDNFGYIVSINHKTDYRFYTDVKYGEYQRLSDNTQNELMYATKQSGKLTEINNQLSGLVGFSFVKGKNKYKLNFIHLQSGESRAGQFNIDNNSSAVGQSGYEAISYNLEYNQRGLTNLLLNGKHKTNKWNIDWKLSPTYSSSIDPDIRKTPFSYDGIYRFAPGEAGNPSRIWRNLGEFNFQSKIDLNREHKNFKLNFGLSHVFKLRNYEIKLFELMFSKPQSWTSPNPNLVMNTDNLYPSDVNGTYIQSGNVNPNPNQYSSNINNLGVYVSGDYNIKNKFKINLGLRTEYFIQRHTGRDIIYANGDMNGNNLVNDKVMETINLFPSTNIIYSITPKQNLRTSYSRTIARPSFKELSYAQILDPITNRIFNGGLFSYNGTWDGNLKSTNIDNLDLRWELLNKNDFYSISGFYKHFNNPIELVRIPEQQTSTEYQPRNVGSGDVYGLELELRKSFLKNFYFNTNVTLVKSQITMTETEYQARKHYERLNENIDNTRVMAGQSPFVINTGLSYKNDKIGLNVGLFYNVKGQTLSIVGTGLSPDVYDEPFHSLNLSVSQNIKNTSIDFRVQNILNDRVESFYHSYKAEKQVFNSVNPGVTLTLGVSHKF
jgi:outer membrane receptor protein involved in Fe transport